MKKIIRWYYIVPLLVLLVFIGRQVFPALVKPPEKLVTIKLWKGKADDSGAKKLIVVVHGYLGDEEAMKDVIDATTSEHRESDVVLINYPASRFSNVDCFKISDEISQEIATLDDAESYKEIQFVGFSMGALLARKAYVYGWGHTEDLGGANEEVKPGEKKDWVKKVKRFVLLAGMNRGWTAENRPKGMNWWNQVLYQTGKFVGWATDTGRLIRQCEKGEPFVANLRMQWLDVMRKELKYKEEDRPTVVQLLGSKDDIVTDEDSRDASISKGFVWVQLSDTGHGDAIDFTGKHGDGTSARARREWFLQSLGTEDAINQLRRMSPKTSSEDDPEITECVIVLHGIRDYGFWTADFFSPLQKSFLEEHRDKGKLLVYRPSYGYFPMGSFLLPIERQKKVRWFMDEVTELKARYPYLETIHFVGHSNGTYVLADALKEYKALRVGRVVLAGSVLPEQFDWVSPDLAGRVEKVHNYVATGDWVVAWFPHLFEIPPFTLLDNEIGGAGHNGFKLPKSAQKDAAKAAAWKQMVTQTWYVKGGHGAALGAKGIESMKPFILDGLPILENPSPGDHSKFVAFFGYVPWLIWLFILTALVLLGCLWYKYVSKLFGIALKPKAARAGALIAYCLFILLLLETV